MEFDKIVITNLPAFYKINLFNEIARSRNILVIFTGNTASTRNSDFLKKDLINFSHVELQHKTTISKCLFVAKLLLSSKYKELILAGWDEPILWVSAIISAKKYNAVMVESSIYESKTSGLKAFIKKIFLSRISRAYASGKAQIKLLNALDFHGEIRKTHGVGLFNVKKQPNYHPRDKVLNFLYVGRLSPEKNLISLITTFKTLPGLTLHIVGFGPEENYLKSIATDNVLFHGAVKNEDVFKLYRKYDVFILASLMEAWGLVIEEALNNGMPVIASDRVGCVDEIIKNKKNGLIYNLEDENGLEKAVEKMRDVEFYNSLRKNISQMDFNVISREQIQVFLD